MRAEWPDALLSTGGDWRFSRVESARMHRRLVVSDTFDPS
jgi:hypothetical protein